MFKRIATWLSGIFKSELAVVEKDAAGLYPHVTAEITKLRGELANATANLALITKGIETALKSHVSAEIAAVKTHMESELTALKQHVSAEVDRPVAQICTQIEKSISGEFEKIVSATGAAAKDALADARKALRMPCDFCGLISWKFTIKNDGKVLCHDCQLKGK